MYFLMICDLLFTLFNYRESEELNPIFRRFLYGGGQQWFVYVKLAMNTAAAYAIIILRRYKPGLSIALAVLGIIIYGTVFYLHIEVYKVHNDRDPITPGLKEMLFETGLVSDEQVSDMGFEIPFGEGGNAVS
jgi:hypothetical protein